MTQQTIIRSACYLCGETIEFPAELANQVIPCPHCGKEIKLFAASKSPSRFGGLFTGRSWNKKQLLLTLLAVVLLIGSLFNAPWEITYRERDGASAQARIMKGTVFDSPVTWRTFSYPQEVIAHRLLVAPLALGWFGLLAVYLPLLFLVRTRDTPLISAQTRERLKNEAATTFDEVGKVLAPVGKALLAIACLVAVIGVVLGIVNVWRDATEKQRKAKEQREQALNPVFVPPKELSDAEVFGSASTSPPPVFDPSKPYELLPLKLVDPHEFDHLIPASNRAKLAPVKRDIFDDLIPPPTGFMRGSCCDRARSDGMECSHPCCVKARMAGSVCRTCNPL